MARVPGFRTAAVASLVAVTTLVVGCRYEESTPTEPTPVGVRGSGETEDLRPTPRIPGDISDDERLQMAVDRARTDFHGKSKTHDDPDTRLVLEIVAGDLGIHAADIPLDRPLRSSPLNADELDYVEILLTLEDGFGFTIQDEDYDSTLANATVGDLVELVKARRTKSPAGVGP